MQLINIGFGKINLHNDIFCIVRDDVLSIEKIAKESKENDFTPIKIVLPGEYKVSRKQKLKLVAISIQEYNERRKNSNLIIHNAIDFKKTNGDLLVRFKVPGDSIKLNGRNCTKTLKKLLTEAGERCTLTCVGEHRSFYFA